MTRFRRPSPQTIAVLAVLDQQPAEWRHGYELCRATGLASGTLYPLLVRLHSTGWLEAEWRPADAPGRPPRHVYRLTPAGRAQARHLLEPGAVPASPEPQGGYA